jgi:hypothetical protein
MMPEFFITASFLAKSAALREIFWAAKGKNQILLTVGELLQLNLESVKILLQSTELKVIFFLYIAQCYFVLYTEQGNKASSRQSTGNHWTSVPV